MQSLQENDEKRERSEIIFQQTYSTSRKTHTLFTNRHEANNFCRTF